MICQAFETLVGELARSDLLGAGERERALAHAESCARCAARLVEEKALTEIFRAVALSDAAKQSSSRVEANLLAAFRQQAAIVDNAFVAPSPNRSLPVSRENHHASRWLLAAAALILALLTFFAWRLQTAKLGLEAQNNQSQPEQVNPSGPGANSNPDIDERTQEKNPTRNKQVKMGVSRVVNHIVKSQGRKPRPDADTGSDLALGNLAEIATAFIPLTQDNLPMTEGGQIMRVKLPRSALNSFGLPVNFSRADETIKADVLLGNDGIARAIRFVQ